MTLDKVYKDCNYPSSNSTSDKNHTKLYRRHAVGFTRQTSTEWRQNSILLPCWSAAEQENSVALQFCWKKTANRKTDYSLLVPSLQLIHADRCTIIISNYAWMLRAQRSRRYCSENRELLLNVIPSEEGLLRWSLCTLYLLARRLRVTPFRFLRCVPCDTCDVCWGLLKFPLSVVQVPLQFCFEGRRSKKNQKKAT